MMSKKRVVVSLAAVGMMSVLCNAGEATRIAAIGDSNTFGFGVPAAENTYPEWLQSMLGPAFQVSNFGHSGARATDVSPNPYSATAAHTNAQAFNPDVVISNLGINDFNLITTTAAQNTFVTDYVDILDDYQAGGNNPKYLIQTKLPPIIAPHSHVATINAQQGVYDTILNQVATNIGAAGVDARTNFMNDPRYTTNAATNVLMTSDGIHPTSLGHEITATTTRDVLLDHLGVAVTSFTDNVNNRALSEGQSFTVNVGSHLADVDLDANVQLETFAFRNRTTAGTLLNDDLTLNIYENYDQTIAGDGGALLGTLIGSSTDTVNPDTVGIGGELVWSFNGLVLDKNKQYSAVFVDENGNVVQIATELDTTNSYSGGRTLGHPGVNGGLWDSEFSAVYANVVTVPEPSSMLLLGLSAISLFRRRRP